ncbi:MAG: hypothetical protein MUC60_02400 [Oscillatoria sp. Prado101]|nr:hypothetical protein [Oscillatoria sp. Prado101]
MLGTLATVMLLELKKVRCLETGSIQKQNPKTRFLKVSWFLRLLRETWLLSKRIKKTFKILTGTGCVV